MSGPAELEAEAGAEVEWGAGKIGRPEDDRNQGRP